MVPHSICGTLAETLLYFGCAHRFHGYLLQYQPRARVRTCL